MENWSFVKMHGLGNDFVIIDARNGMLDLSATQIRAISDRRTGVGCDQLISIEPSKQADAFMRIFNTDGSEADACGNGARCVAWVIMQELERKQVALETISGNLNIVADGPYITVDMGPMRVNWHEIPMAEETDTLHVHLGDGSMPDGVAGNVGNPHITFFVDNAETTDLAHYGARYETHPQFPERVNVGIASIVDSATLRLRVWERGVGITSACGSAACAATAAATRRGLLNRQAKVELDGGALDIEWRTDGHVTLTGPTAISFQGRIDESLMIDAV
jgi:diaminopimelate epimerase